MGKVKINKKTGKAVKSSESAKARKTAGTGLDRYAGSLRRVDTEQEPVSERESMLARAAKDSRKYKEWANLYIPHPPERKSEDFNWNQYAGSSRRIGQNEERKSKDYNWNQYAGSSRRIQSSDDYNMNQYAGSSRRIGQQKEKRSEDFNWNQYAGSSRRIGQESGQPAKASLKDTSAPAKQKATTYTIKKGDTLGSIAKRYGVDWRALAEANGIDDPNLIYAGVKLKIDPATMGKRNKRKVGVNRPRIAPPGMHAGERTFRTPTRAEATATNLPMGTGRINIDLPEDYY